MIDKVNLIPTLLERLDKLTVGHCLDIRTYKRNRSVLFVKKSETSFRVFQDGYEQLEHTVPLKKMGKFLKTLLRKEFPRSRKVRLYELGAYDPMTTHDLGRKKL